MGPIENYQAKVAVQLEAIPERSELDLSMYDRSDLPNDSTYGVNDTVADETIRAESTDLLGTSRLGGTRHYGE